MITNCGVGITTNKPLPKRREHDFYATDPGTVQRVLERYQRQTTLGRKYQYPKRVLDPGAGSGNWGRGCRSLFELAHITGVELRDVEKPPSYDDWLVCDFIAAYQGLFPAFDLVCGNPPFNRAEEFVRTGLGVLHEGGHLIYLLRLAFLEGQRRRDGLFAEFPPQHVWVCSKRPSFQQDGKTNATAFAAFVWQKGFRSVWPVLSWLR